MLLKAGALLILIFLSVEETEAAKVTIMMTSNLTITVVDDGKLGRGQVCDEPSQKPARPKFWRQSESEVSGRCQPSIVSFCCHDFKSWCWFIVNNKGLVHWWKYLVITAGKTWLNHWFPGEEGSGGGEGGSSEPCVGLCLHMLNAITIIVITIVNSNIITIVTVVNSSTILTSVIRRERGLTYPPPPLHPPCIGVCQHRW